MSGSQNSVGQEAPDWENMTKQELHDKFAQMMTEQVHDIERRFAEAIDGVEKLIDTKLDAKFTELLARLPPQHAVAPARPPLRQRARRLCLADTQASAVGAPAAADAAASDIGRTRTTWLIPRVRWNKKRTMNNHLAVHMHTILNVDTHHTLRYAMMNMCLN